MVDKIISNPTLFYTIFTLLCIFLILFIVFIASFIKKRVERNKLKKTSNAILTEHYEDENTQDLDEEIKKIEEKVKQNEEVVKEKKETDVKNNFIIGEPIQIEINGELGGDLEEVKNVEVNQHDYIDNVLSKMQEDLTKRDEKQIHEFEKEQEESAIISYQELLKANNKDKLLKQDETKTSSLNDILSTNSNNVSLINVNSMEDLSIISLDDDNYLDKTIDIDKEIKNLKETITSKVKNISNESSNIEIDYNDNHFKTSDFISPVYGRIETKLDYPTIPSIDKLKDKPISEMKDDEFLSVLKAFRRNL